MKLTERIQEAGTEVVKAKAGTVRKFLVCPYFVFAAGNWLRLFVLLTQVFGYDMWLACFRVPPRCPWRTLESDL